MDYWFKVYEKAEDVVINNDSVNILFVLQGEVTIFKKNNFEIYEEYDFLLIKPYQKPKLITHSKKVIVLSINKLSFNRFSLFNWPSGISDGNIYNDIIETYLNTIISLYEEDKFSADISVIKLINYVRLSKTYKDYTFLDINPLVKEVIEYIDKNYKESLTVSGIAEEFYVNSSYLSRIFSENMNMTLLTYIRKIKIFRLAASLIFIPNSCDLWKNYGYESYETYLKHFKMVFSMSPSEFIEKYADKQIQSTKISNSTYNYVKLLLEKKPYSNK